MLSQRIEARRQEAIAALDPQHRSANGQFFTPLAAAELMAAMPRLPETGMLRILDPGAGVGSLTAALVERVHRERPHLCLRVACVEVDPAVLPWLHETAAEISGNNIDVEVVQNNFIIDGTGCFRSRVFDTLYDVVIQNPPYGKLAAGSVLRRAMQAEGVDCPNTYAAFMALGHRLLKKGGQLVSIVPRSFANGAYFENFRKDLLHNVAIDQLHEFASRSTVFADTGVLQENIILSATKHGSTGSVKLSVSLGHQHDVTTTEHPYDSIVKPNDPHQFIRFPSFGELTGVAPTKTLS